jgi:p-aminobenzoyl-glutamate transporter AbgT
LRLILKRLEGCIFLLPLILVFLILGLTLCWVSNGGISNGWSDYTIGGFFLAEFSPIAMEATRNIFQLNLWGTYFLFFTVSLVLSVCGKYLETKIIKEG